MKYSTKGWGGASFPCSRCSLGLGPTKEARVELCASGFLSLHVCPARDFWTLSIYFLFKSYHLACHVPSSHVSRLLAFLWLPPMSIPGSLLLAEAATPAPLPTLWFYLKPLCLAAVTVLVPLSWGFARALGAEPVRVTAGALGTGQRLRRHQRCCWSSSRLRKIGSLFNCMKQIYLVCSLPRCLSLI